MPILKNSKLYINKLHFAIYLFAVFTNGYSQNHNYIQYTTADGLPTNYVYGVVEDKEGYIWAYTENGIAKFDGYDWKVFNQKNGMSGNDIVFAVVHQSGAILTESYNTSSDVIFQDSIINFPPIYGMLRMSFSGQEFFYSRNVYRIDFQSRNIQKVNYDHKNRYIHHFKNDTIYTLSASGLISKLHLDKTLDEWQVKPPEMFQARHIQAITLGDWDYIITCAIEEVCLYDLNNKKSTCFKFEDYGMNATRICALAYSGEKVFVQNNSGFLEIVKGPSLDYVFNAKELASQFYIHRSMRDSKGNIWVGTRDAGLIFIPLSYQSTQLINNPVQPAKNIEGIAKLPSGRIVAASDNGYFFTVDDFNLNQQRNFSKENDVNFYGFVKDQNGDLYYNSNQDFSRITEPFQFEPFTQLKEVTNNEISKIINYAQSAHDDPYHNGFWFINRFRTSLIAYDNNEIVWQKKSKNKNHTVCYQLTNGNVLLAEDNIIWKYNFGITDSVKLTGISHISSLSESIDKTWLIGTESFGLYEYEPATEKFERILDCGFVKKIKKYGKHFYVGTYTGVYVLENIDEKWTLKRHLSTKDGLPSNEVHDFVLDGMQLYAATTGGLSTTKIQWKSDYIKDDLEVSLVSTEVNGKEMPILQALGYIENTIAFKYNLLHYPSNKKISYRYRLDPLQKEWQTSAQREVIYHELPPGNYTFEVNATDIYGGSHTLKHPVEFTIPKPFWKTMWFYAFCGFLGIGLLWYVIKRRENLQREAIEKEKIINKKISDLELSALKAQMNPHFVFNALGSIQYYIHTHKYDEADEYLTRFALLMRKYLDCSKEKMISLSGELELLKLYTELEAMRFEQMFDVDFIIEVDQPDEWMLPTMMIQPFVENAINHGLPGRKDQKGKLVVLAMAEGRNLIVYIRDNGIGIENAKKAKRKGHTSQGMDLIKEKIKTINRFGIINMEVSVGELSPGKQDFPGTEVKLSFKYKQDEKI